jgi:hypothetical protein
MDFSNQQRSGNMWARDLEFQRKLRAESEAREAARQAEKAEKAKIRAKQTKGRLQAIFTNPNDNPTPGANYGPNKPEDVKKAFAETQANTESQWANDKGVVGPTGSEGDWFFKKFFNNPSSSGFGENQEFAAQHDMQATDASLQANSWGRKVDYKVANVASAVAGVAVIKLGGGVNTSLKVTKGIFGALAFDVRSGYYGGGGASGGW